MDLESIANKFKTNGSRFVKFIEEVATLTSKKHPTLGLNTMIYTYLSIAIDYTKPQDMIENFIEASTMPSADNLKLGRQGLPIIEGKSRFPYWENVRVKNVQFFIDNVTMLIPKIDLSKLDSWKMIISDLKVFTKEFIEAEIKKLLTLFQNNTLIKEDIDELWSFLAAYIKDSIRYTYLKRESSSQQPKFFEVIDVKRECRLFMNPEELKKLAIL